MSLFVLHLFCIKKKINAELHKALPQVFASGFLIVFVFIFMVHSRQLISAEKLLCAAYLEEKTNDTLS